MQNETVDCTNGFETFFNQFATTSAKHSLIRIYNVSNGHTLATLSGALQQEIVTTEDYKVLCSKPNATWSSNTDFLLTTFISATILWLREQIA
jgi:hypothetical protein